MAAIGSNTYTPNPSTLPKSTGPITISEVPKAAPGDAPSSGTTTLPPVGQFAAATMPNTASFAPEGTQSTNAPTDEAGQETTTETTEANAQSAAAAAAGQTGNLSKSNSAVAIAPDLAALLELAQDPSALVAVFLEAARENRQAALKARLQALMEAKDKLLDQAQGERDQAKAIKKGGSRALGMSIGSAAMGAATLGVSAKFGGQAASKVSQQLRNPLKAPEPVAAARPVGEPAAAAAPASPSTASPTTASANGTPDPSAPIIAPEAATPGSTPSAPKESAVSTEQPKTVDAKLAGDAPSESEGLTVVEGTPVAEATPAASATPAEPASSDGVTPSQVREFDVAQSNRKDVDAHINILNTRAQNAATAGQISNSLMEGSKGFLDSQTQAAVKVLSAEGQEDAAEAQDANSRAELAAKFGKDAEDFAQQVIAFKKELDESKVAQMRVSV